MFWIIIILVGLWSAISFFILLLDSPDGLPFEAEGFEFVNPVYIYRRCRVNVFGAILISLLMSLICPFGTVGYWIYKLCTVGRKKDSVEYF